MKCHYCKENCSEVFEQGNILVVAHKECAIKNIEKTNSLLGGKLNDE